MPIEKSDITAVTVTYGDRRSLLRRSIDSAYREGIRDYVIVFNGVSYDADVFVEREIKPSYNGLNLSIFSFETNTGSAKGYKKALELAMTKPTGFILMIDDDAELLPDCVDVLIMNYDSIQSQHRYEKDALALSALRVQHKSDLTEGTLKSNLERSSAFRRFSLIDLPKRIFRRFFPIVLKDEAVRLYYTVYSGLFFHRSLLDKNGLPDEKFVLYGDDLEFTYRITAKGGGIWLVSSAKINDMEISWWCRKSYGNPFDALILCGNDKLVYYAFRNEVYFERYCLKRRGLVYNLHKFIYMSVLFANSLRHRRIERFKVLLQALKDGQRGTLGEHVSYPIQS